MTIVGCRWLFLRREEVIVDRNDVPERCIDRIEFGLLAGINVLAGVVAALGAAAVASAILVILELRDPYSGLFRMPDWELEMLIKTLSANTQAKGVAPQAS